MRILPTLVVFLMSSVVRILLIAPLAATLCACGSDDSDSPPPTAAVLSAFPAELAAVLEHATVTETVMVDGHVFRKGTLAGVPVVMAMTGIGLLNATATTQTLLVHFSVQGVIVSGVAGSSVQIGDVTVPTTWELDDGTSFAANPEWLALARQVAAPGVTALDQCTRVTAPPTADPVCFPRPPLIAVGGVGHSSDPFGTRPFMCSRGDVFGCDVAPTPSPAGTVSNGSAARLVATAEPEPPIAEDMETAAIAREAAARNLPFIGFRAVSDGAGDPLGLPGFPTQFFAYYPLAAHNAAAAVAKFLERVAAQ